MSQVANEIYRQLGGRKFGVMVGIKNLMGDDNSLQFRIGSGAKNKINCVRVTLLPSDTYRVDFYCISKSCECQLIESHDDVYCDMLQDVFTEATGFYTSL